MNRGGGLLLLLLLFLHVCEDGYYLPVFTQSGIRVLHEIEREEPAAKAKPKTKKTKAEATEEESLVFSGPGAFYEVMSERVAFRSGPSLGAKALGQLRKGEEVELFGWDESGLWRECVDHRLARSGFVLLDHPELGPLLRPKGEPLCIRPLSVLAVAAQEGRYEDLERFLAKARTEEQKSPENLRQVTTSFGCYIYIYINANINKYIYIDIYKNIDIFIYIYIYILI